MNKQFLITQLCEKKDIPDELCREISSYWEKPDAAARIIQRKWKETEPRRTIRNNVIEGIKTNICYTFEDYDGWGSRKERCIEASLREFVKNYNKKSEFSRKDWKENTIERMLLTLSNHGWGAINGSFHQYFTFELKRVSIKRRISGLSIVQYNMKNKYKIVLPWCTCPALHCGENEELEKTKALSPFIIRHCRQNVEERSGKYVMTGPSREMVFKPMTR